MNLFSLIAILLACSGLLGLSTYSAQQRNKEIGVRKILGASISNIVFILSKDFMKLVFLSLFIAIPISWLAMEKWLEDYIYRIHIQWWVFALAGSSAIAIAFVTISFQAVKAALANPVKSLRSE